MTQQKDLVDAFEAFIVGCKTDGIWDPIKACCLMVGWNNLNGALIPLKGAAPTNFNFVSGDYNRKTGLKGDGSTKYLDSNRDNNADPQDDQHLFCNLTSTPTGTMAVMGRGSTESGSSNITFVGGTASYRSRNSNTGLSATTHGLGGFGASRASSGSFSYLSSTGVVSTASNSSQTPFAGSIDVFRRNANSPLNADARISFYSIGESLDLEKLDARVSTLMTAIGAAIP